MSNEWMSNEFDLVVKENHRHDFNKLAAKHPQLKQYLLVFHGKTTVDFTKPEALHCLTAALMNQLFQVKWSLPPNHLCPRVPSRINYLTWVQAIYKRKFNRHVSSPVIDIGTGAGLIYPLIGSRLFNWSFVATELDPAAANHSQQLLEQNTPDPIPTGKIRILQSHGQLLSGLIDPQVRYSLTVCNPPFFDSEQNSLSAMTEGEHHTQGGEYAFLFRIYVESLALPNIEMFTCLVGRRISFYEIRGFLLGQKKAGLLDNVWFGMLIQGNCKRFAVAWTVSQSHYERRQLHACQLLKSNSPTL